jgi:hypothetical protein
MESRGTKQCRAIQRFALKFYSAVNLKFQTGLFIVVSEPSTELINELLRVILGLIQDLDERYSPGRLHTEDL